MPLDADASRDRGVERGAESPERDVARLLQRAVHDATPGCREDQGVAWGYIPRGNQAGQGIRQVLRRQANHTAARRTEDLLRAGEGFDNTDVSKVRGFAK